MNNHFPRFNSLAGVLASTAVVAAVVISQPAVAKSAKEVAAIAIPTTVRVDHPERPDTSGSGVIIGKEGNTYTVLTANHTVRDEDPGYYIVRTIKNKIQGYRTISVQKLNQNGVDLAVVKFQAPEEHQVAPVSDSDQATIGSGVYVSGYPVPTPGIPEREYTFTGGQVISRRESGKDGYTMVYDAVTRLGMSGGPVFDVNGRVVAIHGQGDGLSAIKNEATGGQETGEKTGRNLGIPINTFIAILSQAGVQQSQLQRDNAIADNDEAKTPPRSELNSWVNNFALGVGIGIIQKVIPVSIPGFRF